MNATPILVLDDMDVLDYVSVDEDDGYDDDDEPVTVSSGDDASTNDDQVDLSDADDVDSNSEVDAYEDIADHGALVDREHPVGLVDLGITELDGDNGLIGGLVSSGAVVNDLQGSLSRSTSNIKSNKKRKTEVESEDLNTAEEAECIM
ncbi:hypothetical protein HDV05_005001 [Chytridiales sp. JEL 0842]|nr:hypothetical protein HDV05_005001 [Chytridiales sp. JEL 0842]